MSERRDGRCLTVETVVTFGGEPVPIEVLYPSDFPDFAPLIYGPPELLGRHQNNQSGNLCVLEDPGNDWWPGWSAAELVVTKLGALLDDTAAGPEAVHAGEADMVESVSGQIQTVAGEALLVPDPFWAPDLAVEGGTFAAVAARGDRAYVLADAEGLGTIEPDLLDRLTPSKPARLRGRWVALPEPPPPWPSTETLLAAAHRADPTLLDAARAQLMRHRGPKQAEATIAITFIEDGPRRGLTRRAWVLARLAVKRQGRPDVHRLVRAQALTKTARAQRTPELVGLDAARVAVVGAGSLGAPVTLELAKAGVGRIELFDDDFYDVNNAVRHVLSVRDAGLKKAMAVAMDARGLNPFITVDWHPETLRGIDASDILAACDVMIDTTGSQSVSRALQRRCRDLGKILVVVGITNGGYGGDVGIFRPDGPCFMCMALHQDAGDIPSPSSGPRSNVTPTGCGHPAFAGAGFDATALAAAAARAVIGVGGRSDYPEPEYDWVVMNFRGANPWRQGRLTTFPGCPLCG